MRSPVQGALLISCGDVRTARCVVFRLPLIIRLVVSQILRLIMLKKEHSASFIPPSTSKSTLTLPYSASNAQFTPFIALDCRGLEFTTFHFRGKWRGRGEESGTEFEVDLDEGEEGRWDDYDEKAAGPVGISEMRAKIERA